MYSTLQDIQDEFAAITFGTQSKVSASQVTEWITQESYYIDGIVSRRYVTPVVKADYPAAYSILKRICIFRVAERVKNKLEVKSNVTQTDSEQKFIKNYVRTPNQDLEAIAKGDLNLKDVPLLNASGSVGSACGPTCDTDTCHTFEMDKVQW